MACQSRNSRRVRNKLYHRIEVLAYCDGSRYNISHTHIPYPFRLVEYLGILSGPVTPVGFISQRSCSSRCASARAPKRGMSGHLTLNVWRYNSRSVTDGATWIRSSRAVSPNGLELCLRWTCSRVQCKERLQTI